MEATTVVKNIKINELKNTFLLIFESDFEFTEMIYS
jgi:hypothetical protein